MQRKAETVLKGLFKEANHFGNLDNVGCEKIRAPDLKAKRGSIPGNEGYFIEGLDPTRTHDVCILHGNLQILGTTRVPNLTNLPLAFARQGWMIRWRGFIRQYYWIHHRSVLIQTPQWAFPLCTDQKNDWS